jgi:hypothetical protein
MPNAAFQAALTRDAGVFLEDFGVTVTNGSTTCTGQLSQRDEPVDVNGMTVMRRRTVLLVVTGTAGTVTDGTRLVIDGRTYRVEGHATPVPPDGRHTEYKLAGAA